MVHDRRKVLSGTQGDALTQVPILIGTGSDISEKRFLYLLFTQGLFKEQGNLANHSNSGVGIFLNHRDRLKFFMLSSNNFSTVTLSFGLHYKDS